MAVGEYSIRRAIFRMVTASYPSETKSSRAASRIFSRTSARSRSRLSLVPMNDPPLLNVVKLTDVVQDVKGGWPPTPRKPLREPPERLRDLPKPLRTLPERLRALGKSLRDLPDGLRDLLGGLRTLPEPLRKLPDARKVFGEAWKVTFHAS